LMKNMLAECGTQQATTKRQNLSVIPAHIPHRTTHHLHSLTLQNGK
jgi:hypothetical protein